MLGNLLGGFIVIIVGTSLVPVIANSIAGYANASVSNVTGASYTIISLTTLFFVIAVMTTGVSIAVSGLQQTGLLNM